MTPWTAELLDLATIARYEERRCPVLIPVADEEDSFIIDSRLRLAIRQLADDLDRLAMLAAAEEG